MVACSIKEMVEDVVKNGEFTEEDVLYIDENLSDEDVDIDVVLELLSVTQALDDSSIHTSFDTLLARCLEKLYAPSGELSNLNAKDMINLFDSEDTLTPHERGVLKELKQLPHSNVFQKFLDDNCI